MKASASTVSFVIVFAKVGILSRTSSLSVTADDMISINYGSTVNDFYGDNVQTMHSLDSAPIMFEGSVKYDLGDAAHEAYLTSKGISMTRVSGVSSVSGLDVMGSTEGGEMGSMGAMDENAQEGVIVYRGSEAEDVDPEDSPEETIE